MGIMPGENASLIEGKDEEEIIPSVILEQLKKNIMNNIFIITSDWR